MNIVYSFVGKLPEYIIDSIYQTRLFFSGKIYLILDDINSNLINKLKIYNIEFINYNTVLDIEILKYEQRFSIINSLNDRSKLFFRAVERFFLVKNLIKKLNLTNILFIELDNLIYDDPNKWLNILNNYNMAIMYSGYGHICTGVCYIKNIEAINEFTYITLKFLESRNCVQGALCEMTILANIYQYLTNIHFLPGLWKENNIDIKIYENFELYNTIFDPGNIGVFLYGMDPIHTNGKIVKGLSMDKFFKNTYNYTKKQFVFELDDKERKIPYIIDNNNNKIRINNLNINSKDLRSALSKSEL